MDVGGREAGLQDLRPDGLEVIVPEGNEVSLFALECVADGEWLAARVAVLGEVKGSEAAAKSEAVLELTLRQDSVGPVVGEGGESALRQAVALKTMALRGGSLLTCGPEPVLLVVDAFAAGVHAAVGGPLLVVVKQPFTPPLEGVHEDLGAGPGGGRVSVGRLGGVPQSHSPLFDTKAPQFAEVGGESGHLRRGVQAQQVLKGRIQVCLNGLEEGAVAHAPLQVLPLRLE